MVSIFFDLYKQNQKQIEPSLLSYEEEIWSVKKGEITLTMKPSTLQELHKVELHKSHYGQWGLFPSLYELYDWIFCKIFENIKSSDNLQSL